MRVPVSCPAGNVMFSLMAGFFVAILLPTLVLALPNAALHPGAGPAEHMNASAAWSEVMAGEVYSVYTEFIGPGATAQLTGHSFSPAMGGAGSWTNLGTIPPTPPYVSEWNPTISASPMGFYYYAAAAHGSATWPPYAATSGIIMNSSLGMGLPFAPPAPTGTIMGGTAGVTWVDFPYIKVDDDPMNPPPGMGTAHLAWVEYLEGGDGDPNVDGNPFNDPADMFSIWYTYSNDPGAVTPFPFPIVHPPVMLTTVPSGVFSPSHQTHRPAVEVCGSLGTATLPPGAVWVAWIDAMGIWLDADPAPGASVPPAFGFLTGGMGPLLLPTPITLPAPILPGGPPLLASASVALANDNGPVCPGMLHLVFSGIGPGGDMDIFYVNSPDGGFTWPLPPTRINQDPIGNLADQWAPAINVDRVTGEIRVTYYDRRRGPTVGIETWASSSFDCGATWTDGIVSDVGPKPAVSSLPPGPIFPGELYIGDYLGSDFQIMNGFAHVWNDGRNMIDQDVLFDAFVDPDMDNDMFPASVDCNDGDPNIYPGATEIPDDGIDQDCNGNDAVTCYVDYDQDGYGSPTTVIAYDGSCDLAQQEASTNGDCDDSNVGINPGATEIVADGVDQNCDGIELCYMDGDGDSYGTTSTIPSADMFCNGYQESYTSDDCDDGNISIYPGATEIVDDGVDQDCNGADAITCYVDFDQDGYGNDGGTTVTAPDGTCDASQQESTSMDDCDDNDNGINPGAFDIPNDGIDQDCDGQDAGGCCVGMRGDVDGNGTQDISDLTYLVDYFFGGGPAPACFEEADVDGSLAIDISDITYIVAWMFSGGPPPLPC